MEKKKNILWITADFFIDVDLPIIPFLCKFYNITWRIIISKNTEINYSNLIKKHCGNLPIAYEIIKIRHRLRDPRIIPEYFDIIKSGKKKYDLTYINFIGIPYFYTIFFPFIHKKNTIIAIHNVTTPRQASNALIATMYTKWMRNTAKNIQVFSKNQLEIIKHLHPQKNIFYAPLALKDFGESNVVPDNKEITFLFFGFIRGYKRLDVLIEAAQIAYEKTKVKFKVIIAGKCDNWDIYDKIINYPELFELKIRSISNEEVPDLFCQSHYYVLPYQDIAQSGALTVGLRYNIPVIASDLPAFKELLIDNITGYSIKPADKISLAERIIFILNNHEKIYSKLKSTQKEYVDSILSTNKIASQYIEFFNSFFKK